MRSKSPETFQAVNSEWIRTSETWQSCTRTKVGRLRQSPVEVVHDWTCAAQAIGWLLANPSNQIRSFPCICCFARGAGLSRELLHLVDLWLSRFHGRSKTHGRHHDGSRRTVERGSERPSALCVFLVSSSLGCFGSLWCFDSFGVSLVLVGGSLRLAWVGFYVNFERNFAIDI